MPGAALLRRKMRRKGRLREKRRKRGLVRRPGGQGLEGQLRGEARVCTRGSPAGQNSRSQSCRSGLSGRGGWSRGQRRREGDE